MLIKGWYCLFHWGEGTWFIAVCPPVWLELSFLRKCRVPDSSSLIILSWLFFLIVFSSLSRMAGQLLLIPWIDFLRISFVWNSVFVMCGNRGGVGCRWLEIDMRSLPVLFSTVFFWEQCFLVNLWLAISARLACKQGPRNSLSPIPKTGVTSTHCSTWLTCGCQWSELMFSCFCSKHFSH